MILLPSLTAFYIFFTFYKLKNNIHLEKKDDGYEAPFFTDILHELRTQLTLISLPVDNILKENLEPNIKEQLTLVRPNHDRVLGLINQILDFRKMQNNKMWLAVKEVNFGEFVNNSSSNFIEIAHSKNIHFHIIDNSFGAKIRDDPERFDSIIYNLLSNAFKFTVAGKNITVKTSVLQNTVVLPVID